MSSSLTYTFRKRRIWPASSRRCGFRSGNCWSSTENSSPRLVAEHVIRPAPAVRRRRAVGICTVMVISRLHGLWDALLRYIFLRRVQRPFEVFVEFRNLRWDRLFRFVLAHKDVGGFQTVAGDTQNRRLLGQNAVLPVEFV